MAAKVKTRRASEKGKEWKWKGVEVEVVVRSAARKTCRAHRMNRELKTRNERQVSPVCTITAVSWGYVSCMGEREAGDR